VTAKGTAAGIERVEEPVLLELGVDEAAGWPDRADAAVAEPTEPDAAGPVGAS
jgi:hypothetical protein